MKKNILFVLPFLALSIGALSGCTKDDVKSLFNIADDLQSQIDNLKNEISDLKNQIEALKIEKDNDISALKSDYQNQIAEINSRISADERALDSLNEQLNTDKQLLKDEMNEKIANLKGYVDEEIAKINNKITSDEQELAALKTKHDQDKQDLQNDYNAKINALSSSENEAREALKSDYEAKINTLDQKYIEETNALKIDIANNQKALDDFLVDYASDKQAIENDYNNKITSLTNAYNAKVEEFNSEITSLNEQIASLTQTMNEQISSIQNDYNTKINDLTSRVSALENVPSHTVTFDSKGGTPIDPQIVLHGEKANKPIDPIKDCYTFAGWYDNNDDKWAFNGYSITSDITLYAEYELNDYVITLDPDGGVCEKSSIEVTYTKPFELPIPSKEGYKFTGWYFGLEEIDTSSYRYTSDINVKANWVDLYTINFDVQGGDNEIAPIGMNSITINELPTPTKDSCVFLGWLLGNDYITLPYVNADCLDLNLVASWKIVAGDYGLVDNGDGSAIIANYTGLDTDIIIPEVISGKTITGISTNAFRGNTNIKSIKLPNSMTNISDNAFENCTSLENIYFTNGMDSAGYGENLLLGCSSLKHISIDCVDFRLTQLFDYDEANIPEGLEIKLYYTDDYTNPSNRLFNGLTTSKIKCFFEENWLEVPSNFFSDCCCLKSVVVSNSITFIGGSAFSHCTSLESITIPNSVASIDSAAFISCSSLISITIPNSITSIPERTFASCESLVTIGLPDDLVSIGNGAFSGCYSLRTIVIPNGTKSIGGSVFYGSALNSILVPDSITSFGYMPFSYCQDLDYIFYKGSKKMWNTITADIGNDDGLYNAIIEYNSNVSNLSFVNDGKYSYIKTDDNRALGIKAVSKNITSADLENDLNGLTAVTLAMYAFYDCTFLESVVIPNSIISIGEAAFYDCVNLNLESITIPDGVSSIKYRTFGCCSKIGNVVIPNSVVSIGDNAFAWCYSIVSIIIPNNVTSVGNEAFIGCSSLTYISFAGTIEQWQSVAKGEKWNQDVPATVVHCSDGDVAIS